MHARRTHRFPLRWLFVFAGLLMISGLAEARVDQRRLQATLYDYASAFRWGQMNEILTFFAKDEKSAKPPTSFELERWKQWKVVGYRAQPYAISKDGHAEQVVEIELSNINSQATRRLFDRQRWRYEKKDKVWLLTSGLPSLSQ